MSIVPTSPQLPLFPQEKRCSTCGLLQDLSAFRPGRGHRGGIRAQCRACERAQDKRRAAAQEVGPLQHCRKCGMTQPIEAFTRQYAGGSARHIWCTACERAYKLEWERANREHIRAKNRARSAARRDAGRAARPEPAPGCKRCTKCGVEQDLSAFPLHKGSRGGRNTQCRDCINAARCQRRAARARARRCPDVLARKECRDCGMLLPIARFNRHAETADGYRAYCKDCQSANYVAHRAGRLAQCRLNYLANRAERVARASIQSHAYRARRARAEGSYTVADVMDLWYVQDDVCFYCGSLMRARYHVDHRQPLSRGGTNWPHNLALCCAGCNLSKNDKTEAEFKEWRRRHAS